MMARLIVLTMALLLGWVAATDAAMWSRERRGQDGVHINLQPRNPDTVAISGDLADIYPAMYCTQGSGYYTDTYGFGRNGGVAWNNVLSFDTSKSINVNTPILEWKLRVKEKPAQLTSLKIRTIPFAVATGGTQFMPKNYDSGELKDITPSDGSWTDNWVTIPVTGTGTAQVGDLLNVVSTCSAAGNPYIYCTRFADQGTQGAFLAPHRFAATAPATWADPTDWGNTDKIYSQPLFAFGVNTEISPAVQARGQAPLFAVFGDSVAVGGVVAGPPKTFNFALAGQRGIVTDIDAPYDHDYDIAYHMATSLGGVTRCNMAISGLRTTGFFGVDMDDFLDALIVAKKPKYVFLHLGTNDINDGVSTENYIAYYTDILDKLEAEGITCIVSPMFARDTNFGADAKLTQRNEARADLAAYIATRPTVLYVDARAAVEVGEYTIDGTHLTKAALIRWGQEAGRQIRALLSRGSASMWAKRW